MLAVDKPAGWTSHDVVARVRRALGGAKTGHAGTLDPDATGVLVLCVGRATKISSFLMEGEKTYEGRARLGVTTDTQDASGEVQRERPVDVDAARIREAATGFVGAIEQVPPMFSAVKVSGQKLYRLARRGVEVERAPRTVTIHELEILDVAPDGFGFRVRCSKGTYVRTLVHDLGERLGCGAHLAALARTAQGGFRREDALGPEALDAPDLAARVRAVRVPPEEALGFLPLVELAADAGPLRADRVVPAPAAGPGGPGGLVRVAPRGGPAAGVGRVEGEAVRVVHLFPPGPAFGRRRRNP